MTPLQKIGTFLVRVLALVLVVVGLASSTGALVLGTVSSLSSIQTVVGSVWVFEGLLLFAAARRLGRLLGRDLE